MLPFKGYENSLVLTGSSSVGLLTGTIFDRSDFVSRLGTVTRSAALDCGDFDSLSFLAAPLRTGWASKAVSASVSEADISVEAGLLSESGAIAASAGGLETADSALAASAAGGAAFDLVLSASVEETDEREASLLIVRLVTRGFGVLKL